MIIPIDEKYRIKSDSRQWMIQQYTTRKDRETGEMTDEWKSMKYFSDPSNIVTELAHMMIRTADTHTLTDALAEVDRVTASLLDALTPSFEVHVK